MTNENKLDKIASFGYGVYSIPCGIAVADLEDGPDGFYLTVESIGDAFTEMQSAELLTASK